MMLFQQLLLIAVIGVVVSWFVNTVFFVRCGIFEGFDNPVDNSVDNPLDIPWIASLTPLDRLARTGHVCKPITIEIGPNGTTIERVPATCESGMAHTQAGDRILMPISIEKVDEHETIQHELVHIDQRRNPEAWGAFYTRAWNFTFHKEPPNGLPTHLILRRRSNPDTQMGTGPWACWRARYWSFAIYTTDNPKSLQQAQTIWWDSEKSVLLTVPPESWRAFFGSNVSQEEHPHEIAAVFITSENTSTEAGRRLFAWRGSSSTGGGGPKDFNGFG